MILIHFEGLGRAAAPPVAILVKLYDDDHLSLTLCVDDQSQHHCTTTPPVAINWHVNNNARWSFRPELLLI